MKTRTDKNDLQSRVMQHVLEERDFQDNKWGPDRNHTPAEWLMILGEEVGEANKAALEARFGLDIEHDSKIKELRKELVQVAAVSIAIIEYIDRHYS